MGEALLDDNVGVNEVGGPCALQKPMHVCGTVLKGLKSRRKWVRVEVGGDLGVIPSGVGVPLKRLYLGGAIYSTDAGVLTCSTSGHCLGPFR